MLALQPWNGDELCSLQLITASRAICQGHLYLYLWGTRKALKMGAAFWTWIPRKATYTAFGNLILNKDAGCMYIWGIMGQGNKQSYE